MYHLPCWSKTPLFCENHATCDAPGSAKDLPHLDIAAVDHDLNTNISHMSISHMANQMLTI